MKQSCKAILLIIIFQWIFYSWGQSEKNTEKVFDRYGNSYDINDFKDEANSKSITSVNASFFQLDIESGSGFENPDRQAVLVQVFKDLAHLLRNNAILPHSATGKVKILVRQPIGMPAGALAGASQLYWEMGTGIAYGTTWQFINTGYDPYTYISAGAYHGYLMFNFTGVNWYTSIDQTNIQSDQYDLYSVLLHEAFHIIGFSSLMGAHGESLLYSNISAGQPSLYSAFDTYIHKFSTTNGYNNLISEENCYTNYFIASESDLYGNCNNQILRFVYDESSNNYEIIYTGSGYQPGSSFSHFRCGYDDNYSMTYIASKGKILRHPNVQEVKALKAIGYELSNSSGNVVYGEPTAINRTLYNDSWLNGFSKVIAGSNDHKPAWDIPFGGSITFNVSDIISNDYAGSNTVVGADCIELAYGGNDDLVTYNSGTGDITYDAGNSFSGMAVIKYRPVNNLGQKGNMTYAFINVQTPPYPQCDPNDCNLICGGDFEQLVPEHLLKIADFNRHTNRSSVDFIYNGSPNYAKSKSGNCVNTLGNSPSQVLTLAPTSPVPNKFIQMSAYYEGIVLPLNKPLNDQKDYILNLVYGLGYITGSDPGVLEIWGSKEKPCAQCGNPYNQFVNNYSNNCNNGTIFKPIKLGEISTLRPGPNIWFPANVTIDHSIIQSYGDIINYIVFIQKSDDSWGYFYLDNITLSESAIEQFNISSTISNETPCIGDEFTITYTFETIDNPVPTDDIIIEYIKPVGIDVVSGLNGTNQATINFNGNNTVDLSITLKVNNTAIPGQPIENKINLLSSNQCSNFNQNYMNIVTPGIENLSVIIISDYPTNAPLVNYSISVTNTGNLNTIRNIELEDILPADLSFVSSTDFTNNAGVLHNTSTINLAPAQTRTFSFTGNILQFTNPTITNCISVTSAEGSCGLPISSCISIGTGSNLEWTGSINTDWNVPGNWNNNLIPTELDNITIPTIPSGNANNFPLINLGNKAVCHNITIKPGAKLTVPVNNSMHVFGDMLLETPGNNDASGSLIESDNLLIDGTISIQRFCDVANKFLYLSSPLNNTNSDLFTWNGSTFNANFYRYDETYDAIPNPTEINYLNWTSTIYNYYLAWVQHHNNGALGKTLLSGNGYAWYNNQNKTVTFTGNIDNLNRGNFYIPITLTANDGNENYYDGWNLVGNPYTSALDWDNPTWDKGSINNTVYYWDGDAQNYKYYNGTGGVMNDDGSYSVNGGSRYVPACQGFFVKASGNGTFNIDINARVHNSQTIWKAPVTSVNQFIKLRVNQNGYSDETVIRFINNANTYFDNNFDAWKMMGSNDNVPAIYSLVGTQKKQLSLNSLPTLGNRIFVIPLGIKSKENTNITFTINLVTNELEETTNLFIIDKNDESNPINLGQTQTYSFNYNGGPNQDRYYLIFQNYDVVADKSVCANESTNFPIEVVSDNLITYKWEVSTDGGNSFNSIPEIGIYSGTLSNNLNISQVSSSMNGYQYRCVINNGATKSDVGILYVKSLPPSPTGISGPQIVCANDESKYQALGVPGSNFNYQWEISPSTAGDIVNTFNNTCEVVWHFTNEKSASIGVKTYSLNCYSDLIKLQVTPNKNDNPYAILPFSTGFEEADPLYYWNTYTSGNGIVNVTKDTYHNGKKSLKLSIVNNYQNSQAEAVLYIESEQLTGINLRFYDKANPPLGTGNYYHILFSEDGGCHYTPFTNVQPGTTWLMHNIQIPVESVENKKAIKFQFYGTINSWFIDDLEIRAITGKEKIVAGIIDNFEIAEFQIFPNPANNKVFINGNKVIDKIQIQNTLGEIVESFENIHSKNAEIGLENFNNGLYFITIISEKDFIKTYKIVKE